MMPLGVMQYAMRLELQGGKWRSAASIAEKAAPYLHAKMAPRAEEAGDHELTIKVIGGLPECYPASELPPIASSCVYSSAFRLFSPAVGPQSAAAQLDLSSPPGSVFFARWQHAHNNKRTQGKRPCETPFGA